MVKTVGSQSKRKTRVTRSHAELLKFYTERMEGSFGTEKTRMQAAERLGELLIHIDLMRDRSSQRQLQRELKIQTPAVNETPTATPIDPSKYVFPGGTK